MIDVAALLYIQSVLWLIVFGLVAVMTVMTGRVRAFYRRIAPLGALAPTGATIEHLDATPLRDLADETVTIGGIRPDGQTQLLLFVSGSCPVSRKMIPITQDFARSEHLSLVFCGDDTLDRQNHTIRTLGLSPSGFINNGTIGRKLGVDRVPFAVVVGTTGTIQARGLVNTREHLESLLNVQETGYRSLQGFMEANPQVLTG